MKCIHCGKELLDGDPFCSKCGKPQKFVPSEASFGFRPAQSLELDPGSAEPEPAASFANKDIPEASVEAALVDTPPEPVSPQEKAPVPPVAPIPAHETVKPVIPVIPKRKLVNWKVLCCAVVAIAIVIGGIYGISEGDFFSGSDSKSNNSRRKKDRDDRDDRDDHDDHDDYNDDYYDEYDDYIDDDEPAGYYPQPSYFDCPGCTNGWHDLCNGSGIYRNYGEAVECSCDDGICNQCGGEGIIYFN